MGSVRLLAFYLPQFHVTRENDRWWGAGFTEWDNVRGAQARFAGHRQPRLPGELGFYDLGVPAARAAQASLAREYGVSAFCYYHYWFSGRRLLRRPLDEVLRSGEPDFPFCLCWANESWTRSWSDREGEVLIEQRYSTSDDLEHARYLVRLFGDARYFRLEGRPLLLVYRASALPEARKTTDAIRDEALRQGLPEPFLCKVESDPWIERRLAPDQQGFDAAVEFAPDWLVLAEARRELKEGRPESRYSVRELPGTGDQVLQYRDLVRASLERPAPGHVLFRCATPSWDNSPRRRRNAVIFEGSTPTLYGDWLARLVRGAAEKPAERRLVFVNAWNEWGEGAVLEPDQEWGRAYLEATRDALASGESD